MALPKWATELLTYHYGEIVHQFLLYGAINDLVLSDRDGNKKYLPLRDYLVELFQHYGVYAQAENRDFDIILFYSLSGGFTVRDDVSAMKLKESGFPGVNHEGIVDSYHATSPPPEVRAAFLAMEGLLRQRQFRVALVLDNLDKLAPPRPAGPDFHANIETLRRWAMDMDIRNETDHVVIGLTPEKEVVADELYALDSQCRAIEVPLPDAETRKAYIQHLQTLNGQVKVLDEKESASDTLAGMTRGFLLINLQQLFNRAARSRAKSISDETVKLLKSEVIKSEGATLLEEKEPRLGFDALGGMEGIVEYFREIKGYIDSGNNALVPKAILLAGPPGTGKTIIAEALAKETGRNVVRLGNIRGSYVGESERNLSKALRLITELAPVIVFVDEIDQAIGTRGLGGAGDSGVNERMFGRILEVMGSNAYRGKIIWVAATNRTDVLDEAMLRRFDRIFPVLIPGSPTHRLQIVLSMESHVEDLRFEETFRKTLDACAKGNGQKNSPELKFGEDTKGLTGSDLEIIVRRAKELARGDNVTLEHLTQALGTYKSNHQEDMYDLQTLLAVSACNFTDLIPDTEEFPDHLKPLIKQAKEKKNNRPLEERIEELKNRLGMRRRA